ncbi:MAG: hypothetical protein AAGH81_00720 [Bacteroidota bacterium]
MKKTIPVLAIMAVLACNEKQDLSKITPEPEPQIDLEAEYAKLEETRQAFQLAIKEKRYGDLRQLSTKDMKGVSPGSADWLEYRRQREARLGKFSYDSIVMTPQENVIVSDSVAYDFGTSKTYYTNDNGESVELQDTFLVILKKDKNDGVWKLHREVASSIVE